MIENEEIALRMLEGKTELVVASKDKQARYIIAALAFANLFNDYAEYVKPLRGNGHNRKAWNPPREKRGQEPIQGDNL